MPAPSSSRKMLPQVEPTAAVRTETSATDTTTAAATPATQPRQTAQASTGAITQNDGSVDAWRSSIAWLWTTGVISTRSTASPRSATKSQGRRRRGASYAQETNTVQATITARATAARVGLANS